MRKSGFAGGPHSQNQLESGEQVSSGRVSWKNILQ